MTVAGDDSVDDDDDDDDDDANCGYNRSNTRIIVSWFFPAAA